MFGLGLLSIGATTTGGFNAMSLRLPQRSWALCHPGGFRRALTVCANAEPAEVASSWFVDGAPRPPPVVPLLGNSSLPTSSGSGHWRVHGGRAKGENFSQQSAMS